MITIRTSKFQHDQLGMSMNVSSWLRGTAIFLLSLAPGAMANEAASVVTLVEGRGTITSGVRNHLPAPGVKLGQCDIVRTADKSMWQVEFPEGGKIELGADTRLLADLPGTTEPAERVHYLRSGWVKLTVTKREGARPHRINTPYFDLVMDAGVAVLNVAGGGSFFVQEGTAAALEPGRTAGARQTVGAGQIYMRKAADAKAVVASRPDAAFLKSMPASFRDTVPSLIAGLKGREVQPKRAPGYDHAELLAWQKSDPLVRQCIDEKLIRTAQEALQQAGIDVGPIDGVLGPRTQAALREFQKQHKLAQSGQLDEQTLNSLSER